MYENRTGAQVHQAAMECWLLAKRKINAWGAEAIHSDMFARFSVYCTCYAFLSMPGLKDSRTQARAKIDILHTRREFREQGQASLPATISSLTAASGQAIISIIRRMPKDELQPPSTQKSYSSVVTIITTAFLSLFEPTNTTPQPPN